MIAVALMSSGASGSRSPAGLACASVGGGPGAFNDERQIAHAAAIVATGVERGVPEYGRVIALATSMQEASLLMYANETVEESLELPHDRVGSDEDSLGLFQQRGEGWGSVAERMNPGRSAELFYDALLAVDGWERLSVTEAAQRVQISAFPQAYAQWEDDALQMLGTVTGVECPTGDGVPDSTLAAAVLDRAMSQIDTPYVWGGGDAEGPTVGVEPASGPLQGYDCSGLMVYAFAGIGVTVPHQTQAIWAQFAPPITDPAQLTAGDMLLFSDSGSPTGIHHVGLYLGEGRMLHAPATGSQVRVEEVWDSPYYSEQFIGAVRAVPSAASQPSNAA